jgi:hypothetical protein
MLLQNNKEENAFDFLSYLHERLSKHYCSNGLDPIVSGKEINQYLSILFRFDKQTTRKVLVMLEKKGLVSVQRAQGMGSFSVIVLRCKA